MTNDSFVNHLFSISHNIYQAFDAKASPKVRGVFKGIWQNLAGKHFTNT